MVAFKFYSRCIYLQLLKKLNIKMIDYLTALVSESIAREIVKDLLKEYFRKPLICIKLLSYFSRVLYQD